MGSRPPLLALRLVSCVGAWVVAFFLASCSGAQSGPLMPPLAEAQTHASLVGPLCGRAECQCSDSPTAVGQAAEGFKRFKIELGPSLHPLWATLGDNLLYKSVERASACFYVDLPVGEHAMSLRAKGNSGFGAHMRVSEMGGAGPWWYPTFDFQCGAPGLCDAQELGRWKKRVAGIRGGKHAPCGSVRILGLDWQNGRMPDALHPEDFYLQARLKVYKFAPQSAPGSAECIK